MLSRKWSPRIRSVSAVVGLVGITFTGCSGELDRGYIKHEEKLFPVSGKVLFDGKPARNATIVFHRPNAPSLTRGAEAPKGTPPNPRGECDESGEFRIYTYAAIDGAPEGDYVVTISWKDAEGRNREGEKYPELLPAKYQNPTASGLKASVRPGESSLVDFQLKR